MSRADFTDQVYPVLAGLLPNVGGEVLDKFQALDDVLDQLG
jgi:hypothetical protein